MRSGIYCRLSKDSAGTELGVQRQEALCRDLVAERGWIVAGVWTDNDRSAFKQSARPAFEQLLDAARAGTVDVIVAVDQDRLSRRMSELARLIDDLEELKVRIVVLSGEIDTTSADGVLRAHILGAVAENESRKKSERIRRQKREAALRGQSSGGKRPFGYQANDRRRLDPAEAALVREGVRRFLDGDSLRTIALDWNERGVKPAIAERWRVSALRSILAGPRIAGLRVHHGEIVAAGDWEPIIDRETHEQLIELLRYPRRPQRGRPPTSLLSSVLRCGLCGAKMHHATTRLRDGIRGRYICPPAPNGCGKIGIAGDRLDTEITCRILTVLSEPLPAPAPRAVDVDEPPDIAALEAELEQVARDHYVDRLIGRGQFLAATQALEERLGALRRQAAARRSTRVLEQARVLDAPTWALLPLERQRAVVYELVDRITVSPATPGNPRFEPTRAVVSWRA